MAYGILKCDQITFTNGGIDQTVTVSGIVQSISGNITATGTIQAATIIGTSTVSGATVTGAAGVFTTVTGGSAGFTTVTGTTVTGTTANFATLSGTTITGSVGNFGSGSAAAPSVSVGTTDNGIYSPGADQVAISTNGTGRLFVDASGNVGVGTDSPGTNLDIYGGSNVSFRLTDSTGGYGEFTYNESGTVSALTIASDPGNTSIPASDMRFTVDGSEHLRITSTGQLSHIGGGSSGSPAVGFNGSAPSNSLVIDSSGQVGLGTSAPDNLLHLAANNSAIGSNWSTAGNLIRIEDSDTSQAGGQVIGGLLFEGRDTDAPGVQAALMANANSGTGGGQLRFYTAATSATLSGTEDPRLIIDGSGNVGVGTTSTLGKMHIQSASTGLGAVNAAGDELVIENSTTAGMTILAGNAASANIYFADSDNAQPGAINYDHSNNSLAFRVNGSERARIDSSGRLLVGTSSARSNFFNSTVDVGLLLEGTGTTARAALVRSSADTAGAGLVISKQRSGAVGGNTIVSSGDEIGRISYQGNDGTEFVESAYIAAYVDGTPGANDMPGRLVFSTTADGSSSPTERMRINDTGSVFLQAELGSPQVYSISRDAAGTSVPLYTGAHSATSITAATTSYRVWTNGDVQNTNNSYTALSDIKLKENIVDAGSQWNDIKALRVRNYNLKEGQTHTQIGLIAQEVEPISPGLVYESPDRDEDGNDLGTVTKSLQYSVLYMKAVKALQEAMERIETLEAKVAALESA